MRVVLSQSTPNSKSDKKNKILTSAIIFQRLLRSLLLNRGLNRKEKKENRAENASNHIITTLRINSDKKIER